MAIGKDNSSVKQYSPQSTKHFRAVTKKQITTTKHTKVTKERKNFLKIRFHFRYPIFVSFAIFVVTKSTRQCQILHAEA